MKSPWKAIGLLTAALAVLLGLGCRLLKPSGIEIRSFVLTPLPPPAGAPGENSQGIGVGIRQVKIPSYLFKTAMAVRQDGNEIAYLESVRWAERLDAGLQRVLASNIGALLPTEQLRLTSWGAGDVAMSLQVVIERFDVDLGGEATLAAWWRVVAASSEQTVAAGHFSKARNGASPTADPQAAAALLSSLVADLSQELVAAIRKGSTNG